MIEWFFPVELEQKIIALADIFDDERLSVSTPTVNYVISAGRLFGVHLRDGGQYGGCVENGAVRWMICSSPPELVYHDTPPNTVAGNGVIQVGTPFLDGCGYPTDVIRFAYQVSGYFIETMLS